MNKNTFNVSVRSICCPEKGYRNEPVFSYIRAGNVSAYVFSDGRTLTVGPKICIASFPDKKTSLKIKTETVKESLAALRPRTKNLFITFNPNVPDTDSGK